MASKGPRSKLDHETRARRQKALEASREPRRPKTHWDHVLEEMVWLSKDFESERKWKLAQAKKVAIRASKGMLDPATREEKKIKEEEQRLRKVALNISKDVKKFWMKIEKLVLYKHQLELDEKKKKALDKQLEFLLGQTERYSTMLAENLIDAHRPLEQNNTEEHRQTMSHEEDEENFRMEVDAESHPETADIDEDFNIRTDDESEDNEQTIEEDEALITEEERKEELEALRNEIDLPLEELLKQYASEKGNGPSSPEGSEDAPEQTSDEKDQDNCMRNDLCTSGVACEDSSVLVTGRRCVESNGSLSVSDNHVSEMETSEALASVKDLKTDKDRVHYDFHEEQEDVDYVLAYGEDKDDEATLSEEEELAKADSYNPMDEIAFLQRESEIPIEQVVARYKKDTENGGISEDDSGYASALSEDAEDSAGPEDGGLGKESISESDVEPYGHLLVSSSSGKEVQTGEQNDSDGRDADNRIADAAAAARSAQPTGNTFSTTKVRTKFPFLLKHPLREYQHIGLDWLVTMYEKRLNGILADEMGLGKTIMTIAVLAHLACEKGIWGPHLIVVPTSVMLNWETEFLKWCPAFKILTYFGSAKERKFKRQGWLKPNSFHVCITTYRLVIQDSKVFKRKKWKYLILDEAHLIKNWKSQRWQTLLNFHSKRRILLTGTPLQNDLMELWSLMHFLMPHIFQSHQEFKDWFCNPISGMVEGQEKVNKEVVDRLHNVLRPFILRRLKRDVEKQLPMKHEHVIYCRLSRRQRNLYEDFIASSETQATLASANFFGMISIIMQLRKVCNHPDLFEGRPIISSFDMEGIVTQLSSSVCSILSHGPFSAVDFDMLGLLFTNLDFCMTSWESDEVMSLETPTSLIIDRVDCNHQREIWLGIGDGKRSQGPNIFVEIRKALWKERLREAKERATSIAWWNSLRCRKKPMYSTSLREIVTIKHPVYDIHRQKADRSSYLYSSKLADIVLSPIERFERMTDLVESFMFAIPAARAPEPICWCRRRDTSVFLHPSYGEKCSQILLPLLSPIRPAIVRRQVYFPDRRLIQFDCGKLQQLASLLRKLKSEGHRALIFTQMTKMLDILEAFINLYGYTYMRLDGSTQPEERQTLMQRFNTNPKIFLFILSTRSGGVGINLVGADTVIFYDSDWNPAMDQQAQDRCHRIGQTREVHIYRLISESTIEENILKKANQKRALDDLVIQSGGYNTEFFKKLDPMELFSGHKTLTLKNMHKDKNHNNGSEVSLSNADVEAALKSAEDEADYMALKKVELEEAVDNQEFSEEAIGKMEDDEFINEDELKDDEPADQGGQTTTLNTENGTLINSSDFNEDGALAISGKEDDLDMLADVKQMAAAAAAAGQAVSSFESQLRPIDRYAMRFLELWDPIIDKTAVESQVGFEETEWELDRLEKYKEEMEADIDDDEEPLVYERWDADFATEAYRQHVEALAQHQLMEELELEAKEKEYMDNENYDDNSELPRASKPKSKKKAKKAKFKSLKKGSLSSDAKRSECGSPVELMYSDDDIICDDVSDAVLSRSAIQKKRKKDESIEDTDEEKPTKKKSKKHGPPIGNCLDLDVKLSDKKDEDCTDSKLQGHMAVDREQKIASRIRMGGKVSITMLSTKRLFMIKPEKLKKGSIWSRDCVPSPDLWLPQEDAVLCAVVHEYGTNWTLISDALYGMTAGGLYRGRYRHPVHCCERFRELIQRYVLSGAENPNSDKVGQVVSGKALLKVTEDNIRMLLDFAMDLPDNELLLQKHFTALLSSVWRVTSHDDSRRNLLSSRNGLYLSRRILGPGISHASRNSVHAVVGKVEMTNLNHSRKSIAAALHDATDQQNETVCTPAKDDEPPAIEQGLEVTLQFQQEEDDLTIPLPSFLKLSIQDAIPLSSANSSTGEKYLKSSGNIMESRYRDASRACLEDSVGYSTSTFSTSDSRTRSSQKPPALGKHKLPVMDSIRPSKSKSRKTNTEFGSNNRPISEPLSQSLQKVSVGYPDVQFNFTSPMFNEIGTDDFQTGFCSTIGDVSSLESQDVIPLAYDPGLISDLDDCSLLPEYTDIG